MMLNDRIFGMELTLTITSKITSRGRLTIPREVRDALKLRSGDLVSFEITNWIVILSRGIEAPNPFSIFGEWGEEADNKAYKNF